MRFIAVLDIGLGQIAMLMMIVLAIRTLAKFPNVRTILKGSWSQEEARELLRYGLRVLILLICLPMVAYIAQCEKDGTLHSFISAMRRRW